MKGQEGNGNRLTIGGLAQRASVGVPALRFYERAGLLPKPARSAANYRLYSEEAVARIQFVCRAKELGFTLKEIKDLLELRMNRRTSCAEVRPRAEAKIANIEARIRSLRQMSRALARLAEECDVQRTGVECPLLEFLESERKP